MAPQLAQPTWLAGQDWLLSCARNPTAVRRAWAADECACIPSGGHWMVAEGSLLPSLRVMKFLGAGRLGPVLVDVAAGLAWWLIPADPGGGLDHIRQLTVHASGWPLMCPPVLRPVGERGWLERPDGSGDLTDPVELSAAFDQARSVNGRPRPPQRSY
ncbi:hypothetical protein ABZ464_36595 [Streptomyces sp. NPDC005820]|uniref:hypothetical protein n=1 Tax=Streptomyces sp. NPDC005820 TaxID=3157069 RepID=UPI0033E7DDCA